MKVSKCSASEPAKPVTPRQYSYEELKTNAPEGVYTIVSYVTSDRWLVLRNAYDDGQGVLYYDGALRLSKNATGPFVRVENASVCFEIKE